MSNSRSLEKRSQEVIEFLWIKRKERLMNAKKLVNSEDPQRYQYMVPFVKTELEMHREVRSIWPYILGIPQETAVVELCKIYQTSVEELGPLVDRKIQDLNRLLDVIQTRLTAVPAQESFWAVIRDEILGRLTREAKAMLERG